MAIFVLGRQWSEWGRSGSRAAGGWLQQTRPRPDSSESAGWWRWRGRSTLPRAAYHWDRPASPMAPMARRLASIADSPRVGASSRLRQIVAVLRSSLLSIRLSAISDWNIRVFLRAKPQVSPFLCQFGTRCGEISLSGQPSGLSHPHDVRSLPHSSYPWISVRYPARMKARLEARGRTRPIESASPDSIQ